MSGLFFFLSSDIGLQQQTFALQLPIAESHGSGLIHHINFSEFELLLRQRACLILIEM